MSEINPTREDFESLLAESFEKKDLGEGTVVKGRIIAIEKNLVRRARMVLLKRAMKLKFTLSVLKML